MTEYIMERTYDTANGTFSTVKREEIVRCGDCRYGLETEWPADSDVPSDCRDCIGKLVETWDYPNDEPKDNPVPPDGFCFYGKRKVS